MKKDNLHQLTKLADDRALPALERRLYSDDKFLQVFGFSRILRQKNQIKNKHLGRGIDLAAQSTYAAEQLTPVLIEAGLYDALDRLQKKRRSETVSARVIADLNKAYVNGLQDEIVNNLGLRYLDTGNSFYLKTAFETSLTKLQRRQSWKWFIRLLLVEPPPHDETIFNFLDLLAREDARQEFLYLGAACQDLNGCEIALTFWKAQRQLWEGDYAGRCKTIEEKHNLVRRGGPESYFRSLKAQAPEKAWDFRAAAVEYKKQNDAESVDQLTPSTFIDMACEAGDLNLPVLPGDKNENYYLMTGFPRSGTTLLENALEAHPHIEKAEEESALTRPFKYAFRYVLAGDDSPEALKDAALQHRRLYYRVIDRAVESQANTVIDKTPVLSAYIKYLEKLFPEKKYIFCIRPPYDVVLSNFKQRYKQNAAMAGLNEISSACDFYKFVMREWFQAFPGQTDRVCYVYYDELVTNFEPTIRRVIDFLGVEWDDAVLDFAEHSKKRAVRTPSYANVRKGLSLGVQSTYQNYLFLFDDYCRSKLDPWVEFFGYTVEEPKQ
ncbi:sulfotransferase family protein [Spiribacter salinus]|uniref:sulfotransferase family protein n=1 Tax=Spiribacter salinus TaxID=1335746 RepID=UPI001C941654|nr:sulfotransferase [Spiribacter salinus]MBY5269442.1 hypothetical protein [Spiribacter salinus]